MKYEIKQDYIPHGKSRSGYAIKGVKFIVAHDTGNSGSSAQGNVNWFSGNPISASAHTFVDDDEIIEMIPLGERAWHVRYNTSEDNRIFGYDSNDYAIGVELCYGGSINFKRAYRKYVWYMAYLCEKYGLDPRKHIVGHCKLDPSRKTDPNNALNQYGITFGEFIDDVYEEFKGDPMADGYIENGESGAVVKEVQENLLKLGYNMNGYGVDGDYGDSTEQAVKDFQKDYGLTVDGYYGKNTQKALRKALKEKKEEVEIQTMSKTGFKDVPEGSRYAEASKYFKDKGVVQGYGDGTLGVDDPVKRGDMLVVLYDVLKEEELI